uniref:Uncharacterized protein n=1 Tax=Glossina pallidipes TaxID=7398 RepID=A0A1B0AD43_GLOPL
MDLDMNRPFNEENWNFFLTSRTNTWCVQLDGSKGRAVERPRYVRQSIAKSNQPTFRRPLWLAIATTSLPPPHFNDSVWFKSRSLPPPPRLDSEQIKICWLISLGSDARVLERALNIANRAVSFGKEHSTKRSIRPERNKAGSSNSGLEVAAITVTPCKSSTPSSSVSNWLTTRSVTPVES